MTLEQLLRENTAALHELAETIKGLSAGAIMNVQNVVAASAVEETNKADKQPDAEQPQKDQPAPEQPAEDKPLSYDDAAQALTDLMKTGGRDKAVEVLAKFGAKNLKGVSPEDYAAFIEATKG